MAERRGQMGRLRSVWFLQNRPGIVVVACWNTQFRGETWLAKCTPPTSGLQLPDRQSLKAQESLGLPRQTRAVICSGSQGSCLEY